MFGAGRQYSQEDEVGGMGLGPPSAPNQPLTRTRVSLPSGETFDRFNRGLSGVGTTVESLRRREEKQARPAAALNPCDDSGNKRKRRGGVPRRLPLTGGSLSFATVVQVAGGGFEPPTSGL